MYKEYYSVLFHLLVELCNNYRGWINFIQEIWEQLNQMAGTSPFILHLCVYNTYTLINVSVNRLNLNLCPFMLQHIHLVSYLKLVTINVDRLSNLGEQLHYKWVWVQYCRLGIWRPKLKGLLDCLQPPFSPKDHLHEWNKQKVWYKWQSKARLLALLGYSRGIVQSFHLHRQSLDRKGGL